MKRPDLKGSRKKIHNMKKSAWFRALGAVSLMFIIILLVLGSAFVSRFSAQRQRQLYNGSYMQGSSLAGGGSAYDLYEDTNRSSDTRNGMLVTLGRLYDQEAGEKKPEREVAVTGGNENSGTFNQGTAGMLEQMEYRIRESVLGEVENHYSEVVVGATGPSGEPGMPGVKGDRGERGVAGAVGKTGAVGQTGSVGATGAQGEAGEDGKDGLSTFIAYADSVTGSNMGAVPKETSRYIGIYQGTVRSSDPKDYSWTEYKDKIITYVNDGQPTLKIFN